LKEFSLKIKTAKSLTVTQNCSQKINQCYDFVIITLANFLKFGLPDFDFNAL